MKMAEMGSTARLRMNGLAAVAAITIVASLLGQLAPVIGGPVFAVAIGIVLSGLARRTPSLRPGIAFASRQLLQLSVVLLGALLSAAQLVRVGAQSLPVIATTLAAAAIAAVVLARLLKIRSMLAVLIGVGTAICGASAIAAVASVLDPEERDVAFAVSTIFLFNVAAVLLFPLLGHVLSMSQHGFGLWAGTAVNDTSSVVAAATVYGGAATRYAVVVKLTRTLAIVPITIGAAVIAQRSRLRTPDQLASGAVAASPRVRLTKVVPPFMILFVLAALANSAGWIPRAASGDVHRAATILITAALAGIGLSTSVGEMRLTGVRPLLYGAGLWVAVALTSLAVQSLTGTLT